MAAAERSSLYLPSINYVWAPEKHQETRVVNDSGRNVPASIGTRLARNKQVVSQRIFGIEDQGIVHKATLVKVQQETDPFQVSSGKANDTPQAEPGTWLKANWELVIDDWRGQTERAVRALSAHLQRLPSDALCVELGARSGDVALELAVRFPTMTLLPTEGTGHTQPGLLLILEERVSKFHEDRAAEGLAPCNIQGPRTLDVAEPGNWNIDFGRVEVDCFYSVGVLQYMTADVLRALLRGTQRHLRRGGLLLLAGPFLDGAMTSPANAIRDSSLRSFAARRDRGDWQQPEVPVELLKNQRPSWAFHDVEQVRIMAETAGFELSQTKTLGPVAQPHDWHLLVFVKPLQVCFTPGRNSLARGSVRRSVAR